MSANPLPENIVTSNDAAASGKRLVGRARQYDSNSAKVAACRARNNKRSASFNLSPEILQRLDAFMRLRVDSKNPSETKSQVVERALVSFLRKR